MRVPGTVQRLGNGARKSALDLFTAAMARDWPVSRDEIRRWVMDEFLDPNSTVLGWLGTTGELLGTITLVPLERSLASFPSDERAAVLAAIDPAPGDRSVLFIGGLGVRSDALARGIASRLFEHAEAEAAARGVCAFVAVTARPSKPYPRLRGLTFALRRGFEELSLDRTYYHAFPGDLERVWLYKQIPTAGTLGP